VLTPDSLGNVAAGSHPVFARVYERVSVRMAQLGGADQRRRLLAGLSGRVIEVGAGNGRMFAHYPRGVTEVLAVEPEPRLRAAAVEAARSAPVPVTVVHGVAEELPGKAGEFDAGVTALVLCSVADPAVALAELRRVLRGGGELRFFEHVVAERPGGLRRVQRFLDATVWPALVGGCHTARDTATAITEAGFVVEELERFRFPESGVVSPASPHIRGRAVNPQ
jgi:SAM-dependent methyltransferase